MQSLLNNIANWIGFGFGFSVVAILIIGFWKDKKPEQERYRGA